MSGSGGSIDGTYQLAYNSTYAASLHRTYPICAWTAAVGGSITCWENTRDCGATAIGAATPNSFSASCQISLRLYQWLNTDTTPPQLMLSWELFAGGSGPVILFDAVETFAIGQTVTTCAVAAALPSFANSYSDYSVAGAIFVAGKGGSAAVSFVPGTNTLRTCQ